MFTDYLIFGGLIAKDKFGCDDFETDPEIAEEKKSLNFSRLFPLAEAAIELSN